MTEIIVIAAVAKNGIIGNQGKIPWYIPEDFKHFKRITTGYPCIMGSRTYESLPVKPLPGRENIVLNYNKDYDAPGAVVKTSFESALDYCKNKKKVFICGGASVYKLGVKVADRLEITRVHKDYDGDVSFPDIDWDEWELVKKNDKDGFSFMSYTRK